jgi:5-methyltetrahydropteroyltriglutamate--homocysteine methyltransferase
VSGKHMSDLVGKLFPCSFVGSYPRPTWFNENLGGRDILQAFRDEDFAQAYKDGIRAIIGDQEEAGIDVLADGHLWYDKHQGFIASFLLYNVERIQGIEIQPMARMSSMFAGAAAAESEAMTAMEGSGLDEVFEATMSATMTVTRKLSRGPMRHALNWSLAQRCTTKPVKAFFGMGPVELSATLVDRHYRDRKALLRDLAEIYHSEMQEAVEAGARIVELDDLIYLAPQDEWAFDVEILNRVFDGIDAYKIWHCCHGGTPAPIGMAPYKAMFPYVKDLQVDSFDWSFAQTDFPDEELALFATPGFDVDLGLGVISNKNYLIETPRQVAEGIKKAARYVDPARIHLTSDCGLFAYSRVAAKAKLKAMVKGAELARTELAVVTV